MSNQQFIGLIFNMAIAAGLLLFAYGLGKVMLTGVKAVKMKMEKRMMVQAEVE